MAKASPPTDLRSTAQKYLDIFDITSDLLILRDGSVSLLMQVNAINFGLLSEPEQDAIIYAYAALINSLSFPIEIVIKSQPKDVSRYLEYVDEQLTHAPSELRQRQIAQYRQFVSNLITEQNVLDKTFYLVLPLTALELGLIDSLNPLNSVTNKQKEVEFDKYALIEKAKNILIPRRDHMISQFGRIGLIARQMNTKEIIHLFYTAYNFEAAEGARVVDSREYTTAAIQTQGGAMSPVAGSNPPVAAPTQATVASAPVGAPSTPALDQAAPVPAAPAALNTTVPAESASPASSDPTNSADNLAAYPDQATAEVNDATQLDLSNLNAVPQESFAPNQGQPR